MSETPSLAIFPTDTVYGLGCCAHSSESLKKIYALKDRPKEKPLPILLPAIPDREAFSGLGERIDTLARGVWPGRVTLILPLETSLRKWLGIAWEAETIGLRVSAHPAVRALWRTFRESGRRTRICQTSTDHRWMRPAQIVIGIRGSMSRCTVAVARMPRPSAC